MAFLAPPGYAYDQVSCFSDLVSGDALPGCLDLLAKCMMQGKV